MSGLFGLIKAMVVVVGLGLVAPPPAFAKFVANDSSQVAKKGKGKSKGKSVSAKKPSKNVQKKNKKATTKKQATPASKKVAKKPIKKPIGKAVAGVPPKKIEKLKPSAAKGKKQDVAAKKGKEGPKALAAKKKVEPSLAELEAAIAKEEAALASKQAKPAEISLPEESSSSNTAIYLAVFSALIATGAVVGAAMFTKPPPGKTEPSEKKTPDQPEFQSDISYLTA